MFHSMFVIVRIRCSRKKNWKGCTGHIMRLEGSDCPPSQKKSTYLRARLNHDRSIQSHIFIIQSTTFTWPFRFNWFTYSEVHRYRFAYELMYSIKPIYTYKCNILYFSLGEVGWVIQLRMNVCLSEVNSLNNNYISVY